MSEEPKYKSYAIGAKDFEIAEEFRDCKLFYETRLDEDGKPYIYYEFRKKSDA